MKPRIKFIGKTRVFLYWECRDEHTNTVGFGQSPQAAYLDWQYSADRPAIPSQLVSTLMHQKVGATSNNIRQSSWWGFGNLWGRQ